MPLHRDLNSLSLSLLYQHARRAGDKEGFTALAFGGSKYSTVTSRGPVFQSPAVPVPCQIPAGVLEIFFFLC